MADVPFYLKFSAKLAHSLKTAAFNRNSFAALQPQHPAKLQNAAIASALQLEATRRHASPIPL